ncbi:MULTISPECIES: hypothetical protein [Bacillus cereus group]|uniref:ABC transporter permease n=1 Tax=Bacillus proteolyticus TaxID=2026192 RepID=A0ABV3IDR0_9BACI|nr:hypothetical protein [Bacillus cereus group sp. N8]MBJ8103904.1 hypothetical protein [Bacillus cereus group sp. N8]
MMFEIVGSFIAILLFLFSYIQLKKMRQHETTIYFDGLDGVHASITHNSSGDM